MSTAPVESAVSPEAKWEQIDQLLADVARLSRSNLAAGDFAQQALARILEALSSAAAAFWESDGDGRITQTALLKREGASSPETLLEQAFRSNIVLEAVRTKTAIASDFALPQTVSGPAGSVNSPERGALLACPIQIDDRCVGALELILSDSPTAADRQWSLNVLGSVAELFADYCRQRRMHWLAEREEFWQRLRQFSLEIHRSLDVHETAYAIVNDGRSLIDCDRLTLLAGDERRYRVLAVSGAATCDPRSDAVKRLESLVGVIAAPGLPFVFPQLENGPRGEEGLPPELRIPLMEYLDASGAKSLAVVPLSPAATASASPEPTPASVSGVLVVDQFSQGIDAPMWERLQLVAEDCATALQNSQRFRQAPWMALFGEERWRLLTQGRSRLRMGLLAAAVALVLSCIIPASFEIEARGELQPRLRREVFATDDAVIDEVKVNHDDRVEAGQVLAVLRNPQLDLEYKRVSGELQTTRERLAAVQAARVELAVESAGRPAGAARLSGEEAGLQAQLKSLERQSNLLDEQQAALTVRSPIKGRVLTWDLSQLLQSRPVQRGQVLMTVADPEGPWVLELHVPEKRIGHLLDARQGGQTKLSVTYVLATDPARKHRAEIDGMASSVEPDTANEPSVLVTVGVNRGELENPRPGAGATGRVYCGLRPIAYVWLHDLIDAAWAWVRF
jgi:biotin carboxyl carrier protein